MVQRARAGLILSIPAGEVSLGPPRVGTIHVQAPTPRAPALQHISANSLSSAAHKTMNYLAMASRPLGGPQDRRMRCRRLPTTRPTSGGLQEPICPHKKCLIWTRWRPVSRQNVNYQRAPKNRNSGLVGPHTTPPIVNYKYMSSTRREGYFGLPTLGT